MDEKEWIFSAESKPVENINQGVNGAVLFQLLVSIPAFVCLAFFLYFILRLIFDVSQLTFISILILLAIFVVGVHWKRWRDARLPTQQTLTLTNTGVSIDQGEISEIPYSEIQRVLIQRGGENKIAGLTIIASRMRIESLYFFGDQEAIFEILRSHLSDHVKISDFNQKRNNRIAPGLVIFGLLIFASMLLSAGFFVWLIAILM